MSTPHPAGTMKRMNIRISGLGGQGAVTAAHLLAMAANAMGKYSISIHSLVRKNGWLQLKVMSALVLIKFMTGANWYFLR